MNKHEAIERIESGAFTIEDADLVVGLSYTKNIINQIDEQQKITIPKFVAEWIEGCKRSGWHLQKALYRLDDDEKVGVWAYDENDDLISEKVDIFARAWLDGYTVEKEKLYEKLGVLLVDVPEPSFWNCTYIDNVDERWFAGHCDSIVAELLKKEID